MTLSKNGKIIGAVALIVVAIGAIAYSSNTTSSPKGFANFESADKNGDGAIDRAEFASFLKSNAATQSCEKSGKSCGRQGKAGGCSGGGCEGGAGGCSGGGCEGGAGGCSGGCSGGGCGGHGNATPEVPAPEAPAEPEAAPAE